MNNNIILMAHGSGGRLSRNLTEQLFCHYFSNQVLNVLGDSALLDIETSSIAFTTDSYVIDPLIFPGGDIGKLAISGTVNDLCASGAIPKYISAGFIIEEGLPLFTLEHIVKSMAAEAINAGVTIVAGDTKVVKHGQCDKLYINTSGIGLMPNNRKHISSGELIKPGDKIIITGTLGDHAITILASREKLNLSVDIQSDAAPLNTVAELILNNPGDIHFMRDITRGGLATVLSECCEGKDFGIELKETEIPVNESIKSICGLYGFDPLYLANEGKFMILVRQETADRILALLKQNPLSKNAAIIGEITDHHRQQVIMISEFGGKRIVEMLSGEILPRIC